MTTFVSIKNFAKTVTNLGPRPSVADAVTFAVRLPSGKPYVNIGIGSDIMAALGWKLGDHLDAAIDNESGRLAFTKADKGLAIRSAYSNKGVSSKHGSITFPVYDDICISPAKLDAEKTSFGTSVEEGRLVIDIPEVAKKK